jgi:hypothetical protein
MKSNNNRQQKIFEGALPVYGTKEYYDTIEKIQVGNEKNPKRKEIIKKNWEKVNKSLEAQFLSTCDFVTEKTLRHFLIEFNNRAWKYGLRSMPVMFNILEAFFNYRKPEIYFELIEEENYLISYFDFIDFITSKDFNDDKGLIDGNLTSDLVYNFNVGDDLEKIKFKSDNGDEFIVAGISIIRRNNEVTVAVITGKKEIEKKIIDKDLLEFSTDDPDKSRMINEFKENIEKNKIEYEYEYIDKEKKYIKVIVACRMDLDTMTIDARYIAEETNLTFIVVTDEIDIFLNDKGKFISQEEKEAYQSYKTKVNNFNAMFEVAKMSLYLPYFFNLNEKLIKEETLDTNFKKQNSNPITKRKFNDTFGFKSSNKSLFSLDTNNIFSPDTIKLRDDLFKIETSGYWKNLSLDEIGLDKKGTPIHGKTWVNQSLSWFEAKEENLIIKKNADLFKDENAGFIYILRNPTMEKNIFKIGLTKNEVGNRVNQLSKTSVPDRFYKSQEWNVKDCVKAEKEIHLKLNKYRVDPRREFFNIEYDKAIKVIKEVIDEINR